MMSQVFLFLMCGVTIIYAEERYTTKYDNIDYDEILRSERLLKNYVNCLMDRGSCTPDGSELKKNLPDALKTECSKCSEAQKTGTRKVIKHLIEHKRDWFNELQAKYDPTGMYKAKYAEELKAEGIILD